jgi:NhaP-type Na+/H+ or K+/H+ antiporter
MHEHILVALTAIGLIALAAQWVAWWLRLPAILFLLLAGIVAGPVTGWLDVQGLFGDLLFPFVSLSVAIILFEGSLTLRLPEIRGLEGVVRNLITVGMLASWAVTTLAARLLMDFDWTLALLFGGITVVTGPTVILPMLRSVRPTAKVANVLRWEGIVIDPIGALVAVLVFEFIVAQQTEHALALTLWAFVKLIGISGISGALAGYLWGMVLRHYLVPDYLINVATLLTLFGVFTLSNVLQQESGLLAVTVMGMWLANMRGVHTEDLLDFKESLSVLLISGLFIILAARLSLHDLQALGLPALGVLAAVLLIARPLSVGLATLGSNLSWRERLLIGWFAPRGIVAAAVSALFALRLDENGVPNALQLVPLTFLIIIGTVVVYSMSTRWLAGLLKVSEPEPNGVLLIGANPVARAIAHALAEQDFPVILADGNWEYIRTARMEGLKTYYGNPVSEHADRHLDLVGIGRLMAVSPLAELNSLAVLRYRHEFGRNRLYSLQTAQEKRAGEKHKAASELRGYLLFGEDVSYSKLASWLGQEAEFRTTNLTEEFGFVDFLARHEDRVIPLFAVTPRGRLQVFVADGIMRPEAGWRIISLIKPEPETHDTKQND